MCSLCEKQIDRGFWCDRHKKLLSLGSRFDLLSPRKIAAERSLAEVRRFLEFMQESDRRRESFSETGRSPGSFLVVDQKRGWFYLESDWQIKPELAETTGSVLLKPLADLFRLEQKEPVVMMGFRGRAPLLKRGLKVRFNPSLIFNLTDITAFYLDWTYRQDLGNEDGSQGLRRADIILELSGTPVKFLRHALQAEEEKLELDTKIKYREAAKPDLDYLYALTGLTAGAETKTYL